ncbi:hypothetical protein CCP3SC1_30037 [Gammaproteobacteria bacterium]
MDQRRIQLRIIIQILVSLIAMSGWFHTERKASAASDMPALQLNLGASYTSAGLGVNYLRWNNTGHIIHDGYDQPGLETASSAPYLKLEYRLTEKTWFEMDYEQTAINSTGKVRSLTHMLGLFSFFISRAVEVNYLERSGHILAGYDLWKSEGLSISPYLGILVGYLHGWVGAKGVGQIDNSVWGGITVAGLRLDWRISDAWKMQFRTHYGMLDINDIQGHTQRLVLSGEHPLDVNWVVGLGLSRQQLSLHSTRLQSSAELDATRIATTLYVGYKF